MAQKLFRGNQKLKACGVALNYTPEMIEEYKKCKNDIYYFIENYYLIVGQSGLEHMILRPYQRKMIDNMMKGRFTLAVMARQSGKALDLNTPIFTPTGYKLFKDIHEGDEIYSIDGKKTKVKFETEVMYNHECYNVEFDNGEIIKADADHVWTIEFKSRRRNIIKDITTKELKDLLEKRHNSGQSIRIKIPDPIEFEEKELNIDPYILGLWLGDGNSYNGYITAHTNDLDFYKTLFEIGKIYTDKRNPNTKQVNIIGLHKQLNSLNLIKNKHIPDNYLYNSIENRIALIQGLMDTDGSVTDGGSFEFYNKNKQLIDQFRFLLSSLGVKSRLREKIIKTETYYTLSFCNRKFNFFKLPRKLSSTIIRSKNKDSIVNNYFYIKSITPTDSVPVKCIQVDNSSHLFLCGNSLIPTHNTECFRAFLTHYILFNEYKTVAITANKEKSANEIITKIQISYLNLPDWLQMGVKEFNKASFVLENDSRLFASATSKDALRSFTCHIIIIDEAAHIDNWEEFYGAVAPTISAGTDTKLIMASTPNGLNHFYNFYEGSLPKKNPDGSLQSTNGFNSIFVPWWEVPGRDDIWKEDALKTLNYDYVKFSQEYECSFIGSSNTLIMGWKLEELKNNIVTPIATVEKNLKIYSAPIKSTHLIDSTPRGNNSHRYVLVADVSRGKGLDYSAFNVFDITSIPYVQVCTFRSNEITPTDFAGIIYKTAEYYNECIVLTEINDIGEQVGTLLLDEYGYEHVLCSEGVGRGGKKLCYNTQKADKGIRTTQPLKLSGCLLLKLLLEQNKMLLVDSDTINEMLVFVKDKNTYKAEKGYHDDLAMTLVIFSWLSDQEYFKENYELNTMVSMNERNLDELENELMPLGYSQPRNNALLESFTHTKNMNLPFNPFRDYEPWEDGYNEDIPRVQENTQEAFDLLINKNYVNPPLQIIIDNIKR